MRLSCETFWIAPKGPPSFLSIFSNSIDVKKIPKGLFFYIFWHCDTVQKSLFPKKIFGNFFKSHQRVPLQFFHILQPAGVSQSPKGPPFTILSLRYSADFGRSRLVKDYRYESIPGGQGNGADEAGE